ncbi:MAG: DUF2255 family protein [Actinomycetota bacterium]
MSNNTRGPAIGWADDELNVIQSEEELDLAPVRRDGTLQRPVTMWVVLVGDDVYVRSVNGRASTWFRRAQQQHEAWISVGGVEKDVTLVETHEMGDWIDAAYHAKYSQQYPSIVPSIVTSSARAATLKLVPR